MGNFFKKTFEESGFNVIVSDIKTKPNNREVTEKSDVVIFSVPIHLTEKVIESVIPYTRKNQLLMDFTSLKSMPVKAMMKSHSQVIGLHPMFRPSSMGLKNQSIVMCIGRANKENVDFVKDFFHQCGATTVEMTSKEHDKLMSIIQVLIHFHAIVLGNTIRELGVPMIRTLEVASPIYRLEMDMIGRIFSQNPLLYGAIEMLNPETKHVTSKLLKETQKLAKIVLKKDITKFKKTFKKTSDFLGTFKDDALEEINKLLTHLP